jgi:hypothetical protein
LRRDVVPTGVKKVPRPSPNSLTGAANPAAAKPCIDGTRIAFAVWRVIRRVSHQ